MAETPTQLDGLGPVERAAVADALRNNPELADMPDDLQREALDAIIAQVAEQQQAARAVIRELESSRDKIIKDRAPIERRWVDDINQYEGESMLPVSKEYSTEGNNRERDTQPKVNLTRARTNMAAARVADMLFPANDRNWDIQPLSDRIKSAMAARNGGQPPDGAAPMPVQSAPAPQGPDVNQQAAMEAQGVTAPPDDKDKCDAMREVIQNQLDDSWYSEHGRKLIEDGCKIGIGVMKGPYTRLIKRKRFGFARDSAGKVVAMLNVVEERVPQCTRVDPRFFYPQPVQKMADCERVFELHLMSKSEIKELAAQDGIDKGAAAALLEREPELGQVGRNLLEWNKRCVLKEALDGKYAVWEMNGILEAKELAALGLEGLDDVDTIPVANVWFCQGEVLRVALSVLEADRQPPYWTWNYERADDTIYGYGIPWLYRNPQRSIDSIWLMLLHNLSVSSGPQVFIKKGLIKPADGKYQVRGPKVWYVEDEDVEDVSKAFRSEVIPNNATQLMDVLKLAMELGDEEIALPSIAQGNPNEAVPTAAGLIQLLNASNIVQRRCAKSMDDDMISPMVERFYVWNMLHNDDDTMKGDFAVSSRGTSVLLHKDIKAQHLQVMAQITADPRFSVYLKEGDFLREMFESADVSATLLLRTDQEADAMRQQMAQQQGGNAADQAKAQALMAEVQIKQQQLQFDREKWQAELQQEAQVRLLAHQESMARLQSEDEDRRAKVAIKQAELQIALTQMADDRNLSIADIDSKLKIADTQANLQQFLAGMNARMKAAEVANNQREMALKLDPANRSGTGI